MPATQTANGTQPAFDILVRVLGNQFVDAEGGADVNAFGDCTLFPNLPTKRAPPRQIRQPPQPLGVKRPSAPG